MDKRETILQWLREQGAHFTLVEHPAAYDMQDIADFGVDKHGMVAKNLFLRDSKKGRRHLLVSVKGDKTVDLAKLGEAVGERLSFASENRLQQYLNLQKGEVTPLAVYFDEAGAVEVFLDDELRDDDIIGVHPCDNTATVFLPVGDVVRLVEGRGHTLRRVRL